MIAIAPTFSPSLTKRQARGWSDHRVVGQPLLTSVPQTEIS